MSKTILKLLYYIKKFLFIIILFCIIALIGIYMILNSKQHYTATVILEYTNSDATRGYAPDGSKIDPTEIVSSKNITNVIDNLHLSVSTDYLRNRINIEEIIPDDEKEKKEAAIQNGEDYEYFPTEYEISFSVDSSKSKEFASDVLNSLLSEYFIYYSETHINKESIPANVETLIKSNYDYLETVEVLNNSVSNTINYLSIQSENFPDYRSSKTGYSFKDLYNIYSNISTENIPNLFSYIFQNKVTKDYEILIQKYKNRINENNLSKQTKETELTELKSLIDSYAEKSKEQIQYQNNKNEDDNFIIKNVENNTNVDKTTYDNLILQYINSLEESKKLDIDTNYCNNVLKIFNEKQDNSDKTIKDLKTNIENNEKIISDNYKILELTTSELNEVLGSKNIKTKSNLIISESFNIKIYMFMAFCVFVILGCCGAIILGRIYDIIYNSIYRDKKTGLLNRTKCDQIINDYDKELLNENFFISVIVIKNLTEINNKFGREYGDKILNIVGKAITNNFPKNSELTYNGTNQFLLFIHNSSEFMMNNYESEMLNEINKFEILKDTKVEIEIVNENPLESNNYKIRGLISLAFQKIKE